MRRSFLTLLTAALLMATAAPAAGTPPQGTPGAAAQVFCLDGKWEEHGFASLGECMRAVATGTDPVMVWSLVDDFRLAPDQANPSPDRYGNEAVWSYMMSAYSHWAFAYQFLPEFVVDVGDLGYWDGLWHNPYVPAGFPFGFPFIAKGTERSRELQFHTGEPGWYYPFAVAGWTSPIEGTVLIDLGLNHRQACEWEVDGVDWWVGSGWVLQVADAGWIPNPGKAGSTLTMRVEPGDRLWLVIGPHANYACDSTYVDWTITGVVPE